MNDAGIVKALECCCEAELKEDCQKMKCPFFDNETYNCMNVDDENAMYIYALDLINRKNAEIERLQSILLCFMNEVEKWENKHCLDVSELPLIPIKGESEKIKKLLKAEAIKEFAEKLKENTIDVDVSYGYGREHYTEAVAVIEIDNLVKEMAGEK